MNKELWHGLSDEVGRKGARAYYVAVGSQRSTAHPGPQPPHGILLRHNRPGSFATGGLDERTYGGRIIARWVSAQFLRLFFVAHTPWHGGTMLPNITQTSC
jgi:hypothetical protein